LRCLGTGANVSVRRLRFSFGSRWVETSQAGRPGSIRLSSRRQPGPIQRWKGLTIISVGIVYHSRLWRLPPGEIDER